VRALSLPSLGLIITKMKDTDDAMADNPHDPRDVLAALFTQSHPNITWAIRRAPTYKKAFDANTAYAYFINHASEFLDSIEMGLELMAGTNTTNEHIIASNGQTIAALQQSNHALNALVTSLQSAPRVTTATSVQPKRKAKDPPVFDGKGSPVDRQEKFEIWETKIQNVFQRDADCFLTPLDEVLYMSEMLVDKAYDYVKHGLDMLRQNEPAKFVFSDRESMFEYMRKHYKTIDTS
jgi:ribonucleotide monophosphatase NagD (HAD superfamily)